jgi:4-hydroxybenzoate polyprenyltransferase
MDGVPMNRFKDYLRLIRVRQWTKNMLIFAAPIFADRLFDPVSMEKAILAFAAFCLTASTIYVLNDWKDEESDRIHPDKKHRPLASGRVSHGEALALVALLAAGTVFIAIETGHGLWEMLLAYALLNIAYTFLLKRVIILDLFIVSIGFIMRAMTGGIVIGVPISSWLLMCTFFLALFMSAGKRRHEVLLLGDLSKDHRSTLAEYPVRLLDQMIAVLTGLSIVTYSLYTLSPQTFQKFHSERMVYTIPVVTFGLFRYLYLVYQKDMGGKPEEIMLRDRTIQMTVLIWIALVIWVIY